MRFLSGNSRVFAVAVLVALMVGGTAYAAGSIDGNSLKPGSVALSKLTKQAREEVRSKVPGPEGPRGAQGSVGAAGANGLNGAIGVQGKDGIEGEQGVTGEQGFEGEQGVTGEEGVQGKTGPTEHSYGVVAIYLDGTMVPSSANWTATIPRDGNNGAATSGQLIVTCAVGPCVLTARGAIRSDDPTIAGQGGGGIIVTSAANGALTMAGQTPANPTYKNSAVVDVETKPLTSRAPTIPAETGTLIPIEWKVGTGSLATGTYLVSGTTQFFDFP